MKYDRQDLKARYDAFFEKARYPAMLHVNWSRFDDSVKGLGIPLGEDDLPIDQITEDELVKDVVKALNKAGLNAKDIGRPYYEYDDAPGEKETPEA
jgi:hypothetical protein